MYSDIFGRLEFAGSMLKSGQNRPSNMKLAFPPGLGVETRVQSSSQPPIKEGHVTSRDNVVARIDKRGMTPHARSDHPTGTLGMMW
jgi:hypothetical protein